MVKRNIYLDMLRGVSALLVCAGHLRAFFFVDFSSVIRQSIYDRLFYFLTGLGHQVVMVFFVLSGYLVGGSIISLYKIGKWSWINYTVRRLTRLWVVLLPALCITMAFDMAGMHLDRTGYMGKYYHLYCSGPSLASPADISFCTFLGNIFFLQTITVDCLGTNKALWSLANEFWYYVIFPLLCGIVFSSFRWKSAVYSAIILVIFLRLPQKLLLSGLVWFFGVAAFVLCQFDIVRNICRSQIWLWSTGIFAIGTLVASKTGLALGSDFSIGFFFALWIMGLGASENRCSWLYKVVSTLSEISYTLYVVHFPFFAFIFFCFFKGYQFSPSISSYLLYFTLLALTIFFAWGVWWCFERNTNGIRQVIERNLRKFSFRDGYDMP